jgi:uncharacterized membrane protein
VQFGGERVRSRLKNLWEDLRESFWFLPALMVFAAGGLAFFTLRTDRRMSDRMEDFGHMGTEGYREVLITIATSMITLAGVIFSITILTLSIASQQYGPRLLRNFIRHRGNQFVLGTFVATFIYCILVLRMTGADAGFTPHVSGAASVLLGILSIGVLVFFFHHVAISIQASSVVRTVSLELYEGIRELYPEEVGTTEEDADEREGIEEEMGSSQPIRSRAEGFIQSIDTEALYSLAVERDLVIRIERRPGKYAVTKGILVRVLSRGKLEATVEEQIRSAFIFGRERQHLQDIEFSIEQLVEVAVRALSPSVNDPFTALACLERLGEAFCRLSARKFPSPYRCDDGGKLRLIAPRPTYEGLLDAGLNQIRQYGAGSMAVMVRMLEVILEIAQCAKTRERHPLWEHAGMIARAGMRCAREKRDRRDLIQRYRSVCAALHMEPDPAVEEEEKG